VSFELDPEGTDNTDEEWRKQANAAFSELRANGQNIVKVSVQIDDMMAWCNENGSDPVSSSWPEFTAFKLGMKRESK